MVLLYTNLLGSGNPDLQTIYRCNREAAALALPTFKSSSPGHCSASRLYSSLIAGDLTLNCTRFGEGLLFLFAAMLFVGHCSLVSLLFVAHCHILLEILLNLTRSPGVPLLLSLMLRPLTFPKFVFENLFFFVDRRLFQSISVLKC